METAMTEIFTDLRSSIKERRFGGCKYQLGRPFLKVEILFPAVEYILVMPDRDDIRVRKMTYDAAGYRMFQNSFLYVYMGKFRG